ncbi:MAG: hypothetical protein KGI27_01800 [Thaumarchaeota archaeon]|nr:hypothetical protein [Nitrososphaerota archaeon]
MSNSTNKTKEVSDSSTQKRMPTWSGVLKNLQGETIGTLALWSVRGRSKSSEEGGGVGV